MYSHIGGCPHRLTEGNHHELTEGHNVHRVGTVRPQSLTGCVHRITEECP